MAKKPTPAFQFATGNVYIDPSTEIITFTTKMDVDADGANAQHGNDDLHPGQVAYRLDDTGMDRLVDAGYPNGGWQDVLAVDPKNRSQPYADADGNLVSMTTLCLDTSLPDYNKNKWVDADYVPYIVLPPQIIMAVSKVVLGCYVVVRNTKDGRSCTAVVADIGPDNKIGEASIKTASLVSIPDASPLNGDERPIYSYEVHPGIAANIDGVIYPLQHYGR